MLARGPGARRRLSALFSLLPSADAPPEAAVAKTKPLKTLTAGKPQRHAPHGMALALSVQGKRQPPAHGWLRRNDATTHLLHGQQNS
jgi:hypothetical protein